MRLLVQFFDATAGFLPNINTMEEYSMEYPRRSSQEWLELITDCRTSGMTITAWCKAHAIPKGSYESAVKRLVNQGLLARPPKEGRLLPDGSSAFRIRRPARIPGKTLAVQR